MNLLRGRFCSAQMPVIMGIMMTMVAVALMKQPRNRMGSAMPSMILKSEEPGLMTALLNRLMRLVLPTAAPTTNMEAIIITELLDRPLQASLKVSTWVISSTMGIINAATWILTLPLKISAMNARNTTNTIAIWVVISVHPFYSHIRTHQRSTMEPSSCRLMPPYSPLKGNCSAMSSMSSMPRPGASGRMM